MISYVSGRLKISHPGHVVIEACGIGYKVLIPVNVYPKLPQIGHELLLHTSHVIREISQTLYGFLTEDERSLFEEVMGVSGIGPKTALSLVGHLPLNEMRVAVSHADIKAISRVPGIGKKTAERLIIEMRDRFGQGAAGVAPSDFAILLPPGDPKAQKVTDAINALINLGYHQAVAQKAVKKSLDTLPEEANLPALITTALKNI